MRAKRIYVESSLAETLKQFIESESIALELTTGSDADICIQTSDECKECDLNTLYPGGWISCATALALAKKLDIQTRQVGAIMNHLEIKIKHCSLGCFG